MVVVRDSLPGFGGFSDVVIASVCVLPPDFPDLNTTMFTLNHERHSQNELQQATDSCWRDLDTAPQENDSKMKMLNGRDKDQQAVGVEAFLPTAFTV